MRPRHTPHSKPEGLRGGYQLGWAILIFITSLICVTKGLSQGLSAEERAAELRPLTLAVKYVSYSISSARHAVIESEVQEAIGNINDLYAVCGIQFILETFEKVNPQAAGLKASPTRLGELTQIRRQFATNNQLLVVGTGDWNRAGSLKDSGAHGWTTSPGEFPEGTILNRTYSTHSGLIAHELGHALGLDHVSDATNLMHDTLYTDSTRLNDAQCKLARQSVMTYRMAALRSTTDSKAIASRLPLE